MNPRTHARDILWYSSLLTFGVGDLLTTYVGLELLNLVESNPIAAVFHSELGFTFLILWKAGIIGLTYVLYTRTNPNYRIGIPIGLTLLGTVITIHNSLLIIG